MRLWASGMEVVRPGLPGCDDIAGRRLAAWPVRQRPAVLAGGAGSGGYGCRDAHGYGAKLVRADTRAAAREWLPIRARAAAGGCPGLAGRTWGSRFLGWLAAVRPASAQLYTARPGRLLSRDC